MTTEPAEILLDDVRGIYIPRDFTQEFRQEDWDGIRQADWDTCAAGPDDNEFYWDAWDNITTNAVYCGPIEKYKGYTLYQDGALFLVPPDFEPWEF